MSIFMPSPPNPPTPDARDLERAQHTHDRDPARLDPRDLVPPRRHLSDVVVTVADLAIVTYAVEPYALMRQLPRGFEPDVHTLDDGRRVAFVSAVPFRNVDPRPRVARALRGLRLAQTNYRAYVRHQGRRCVWLFPTTFARGAVAVPRALFRVPWHGANIELDALWRGEQCGRYRLRTSSPTAAAELDMHGTLEPVGRLDGFVDEDDARTVITHPLDGYYERTDGHVGIMSVWHRPLSMKRAQVLRARFSLLERMGLVHVDQLPHSALVQRHAGFIMHLPRKVTRDDAAHESHERFHPTHP